MNPKITIKELASFMQINHRILLRRLFDSKLDYFKQRSNIILPYASVRDLLELNMQSKCVSFQIVKGGTGKTSIANAFAIKANLYGLKVLCIDLDQQGNLTQALGVNAENSPVMIDVLAEGYPLSEAIINVSEGLDVIGSRIENALIDDVIKLKNYKINEVYKNIINQLKQEYDLIVIDCPPSLGKSVAAVTLAVDDVIAPVVADHFALSGLKTTINAVKELQAQYKTKIKLNILFNKFEQRSLLSQDTIHALYNNPQYASCLLDSVVRLAPEFMQSIAHGQSIFDNPKPSTAKSDIDALLREVLGIGARLTTVSLGLKRTTTKLEEALI